MTKLIKRILQVILALILIGIMIIIGIVNFVDPTKFKGIIEREAAKYDQVVTIQGPITWRWFPRLALELNNITLQNPPPFSNTMLSVQTAQAECAILPLLTAKILLSLTLKNLDLSLERNAQGQANWDIVKEQVLAKADIGVRQAEDARKTDRQSPAVKENLKSSSTSSSRVLLNGVNIEEGNIIFRDNKANQQYRLTHVNLTANNLMNAAIGASNPLAVGFQLDKLSKPTPETIGTFSGKGSLKLIDPEQIDLQKVVLKFESPQGNTALLNGEATIQNLAQAPLIRGQVETQNFNLKSWLNAFNVTNHPALPTAINIKTDFQYQNQTLTVNSFNVNSPKNGTLEGSLIINRFEQPISLKGTVLGKQLQLEKFKINTLKATIAAKDNVININPLDFALINSQQNATLQMDLRGAIPQYSITQKGQSFEISDLLALLDIQSKIEGQTCLNLRLTTAGNTVEAWRNHLSGQASIEISKGKVRGINFIDLLKNAQSTVGALVRTITQKNLKDGIPSAINNEVEKWKVRPTSNAFTPFNAIKATASITNGIVNNPDLAITHSEYIIKGAGTVNLPANTLKYKASIQLQNNPYSSNDKVGNFLFNTPLLMTIEGNLMEPSIRPDMQNYMNNALRYAEKELLQKVIDKTLNKAVEKLIPIPLPGPLPSLP